MRVNRNVLNRQSRWWYRTTPELPKELEGKSPAEVAAYYQDALKLQKDTYEGALAALEVADPNPPVEKKTPAKVTMQDFLNDPTKHTTDIVRATGVTREEWTAATKSLQENFIYMAKERAIKEIKAQVETAGGKFLWDRFAESIDKAAKAFDPMALTAVDSWKSVYYYIVGLNNTAIVKDEVTFATMPAELPNAGGNEPPVATPLTKEEKVVAEGLALTEDSWRKGKQNMVKNLFPLTMDNRQRR